jgi:hypothetical protein
MTIDLVIMAGSRLRMESMKHNRRLNAVHANDIFIAPPFAEAMAISRAASAITQQSAATKEKNRQLLTLRFFNNN